MRQDEADKLVAEFLAKGGKVTVCNRGPRISHIGQMEQTDALLVSVGENCYHKQVSNTHDEDNLGDPLWADEYVDKPEHIE